MSKRTRLNPLDRKRLILNAAVDVAKASGLFKFSIVNVSRALTQTSKATIKHYYTMEQLRTAVIEDALKRGDCMQIIAQAIAMHHPSTKHFDDMTKQAYLKHV